MKITCPVCDAKYSITDEKVQDRLAKIRCRKCGTTIVIDGKVSPPSVYAADAPQTSQSAADGQDSMGVGGEYTVDFGENDQRNLSLAELVQAHVAGQVTSETYVWAEGFEDWKMFGEVPELTRALEAAKPAAATPAAAAAALPWDRKPAQTLEEDEDERTRIATRGGESLAGSTDLFGGFATAGSEEEVTTSAQQHDIPPAPAAAPVTAQTGARNESSVLFSLSALTAAAASKPSRPAPGPSAPSEDSGLIDLKALASAAQKAPAQAAPTLGVAAVPLGLSPLGQPPLGNPSGTGGAIAMPIGAALGAGDFAEPAKKNKLGLYILGAAALIGVSLIAVVLLLRPAPAPEPTAGAAPPAPEPVATAQPVEEKPAAVEETQPEEAAAPPATGTAEEESPPEPATAAKKTAPAKKPTAAKTSTKPSKPAAEPAKPAAAPAPKKPSGGCGCAPGDLMCAMRCASK